jgi:hypothetical protein
LKVAPEKDPLEKPQGFMLAINWFGQKSHDAIDLRLQKEMGRQGVDGSAVQILLMVQANRPGITARDSQGRQEDPVDVVFFGAKEGQSAVAGPGDCKAAADSASPETFNVQGILFLKDRMDQIHDIQNRSPR